MIFSKAESYLTADPHAQRVLLDGCFDPVHRGHIRQVKEARRALYGYQIVVGVASDADIRAKGREPVFDQLARCAIVDGLQGVDVVIAKDRPLHELIAVLKPAVLVKGKDWEGKLPDEVSAACSLYNVQIVYLGEPLDSSTHRLRTWAAAEDARYLDELERIVSDQQPPSEPWQPVTDYSFEARKAIEGIHPELIKDVFQPKSVWDVGCGPGFLVTALCELGVRVNGFDTHPPKGVRGTFHADITAKLSDADDGVYFGGFNLYSNQPDVVICREVLEHVPIRKIPQAVANLCKLSSKFCYVTTRFTKPPAHLLKVDTKDDLDPTHCSMLNQDLLRALFVLNGGRRRKDLEDRLDWMKKGRCLVYQVQ